eukprot:TRINITY_DN10638_c0_g1_i1.p1 TRINITY_DN10638_c0_g1~~TRINITY_DN10638_c0_g1_i1.p1  ORF type:complete len:458 (+),score=96.32 TRINITY_DN10638_c0_g1_i1:79-1374(+)
MAASFSGMLQQSRRRAVLLPAALLLAAAGLLAEQIGLAFQVPPLAGQQLNQHALAQGTQKTPGLHSGLFTGLGSGAARLPRAEEPSTEASSFSIFAATAVAALAATADAAEPAKEKTLWDKVKLPVYACLWYFFNVQYNITNKRLLNTIAAPWAISWIQLAAGIPIALLMWSTGFVQKPKVTKDDILKLAPVGAAFAGGQVATVASLGAVAVSFTHVVKALEPAVNAIASALILGQVFHPMVYASLAPVFLGVALASSSELSFTMFGFLTAMASNFFFVTRNVLATKFGSTGDMGEDKTTRKTNQLAVLTFVAAVVLFPIALVLPGGLLSFSGACKAAISNGTPASAIAYMTAASGFHFFMYQLSSFWVLSCVPPITHSVLNTLKRVVIIIVSIIVFRTPVTAQSAAGTATAIGGVLLYSLTKAHYAKKGK